MTNAAIVLARLDSQRFPGKALVDLMGKPLISWCLDTLNSQNEFKVILATSDRPVDDPLVEWAQHHDITCFRGASDDIAQRIIDCGEAFELDYFARVNGDSPLVNLELLQDGFKLAQQHQYDLVTNLVPRNFPYGIAVEVIKFSTFCSVFGSPQPHIHREHITQHFYKNLQLFKYYCMAYEGLNDHDVRLTVDQPEDLKSMEILLKTVSNHQLQSLQEIVKSYRTLFTK